MALQMNLKDGGVEEISPEHLLKIMESKQYAQLVWISNQVCESEDMEFCWVLAHELRHLEQEWISPYLGKAGYFLARTLGVSSINLPKITNSIPTELDANISTYKILNKMFKEDAEEYVRTQKDNDNERENFKVLEQYDPDLEYDVVHETLKILMDNEQELGSLAKEYKLSFDIVEAIQGLKNIKR